MRRFDWDANEAFLRAEIDSHQANTWEELAHWIGRIGHWQFEDYRQYDGDSG